MTDPLRPPPSLHRGDADGWVECPCGSRHWGFVGAGGVLVWREAGGGIDVVLQHRALWSHHGGTWGIPGGALARGETPTQGALRETAEEVGIAATDLDVRARTALVHPAWSYTTVVAEARGPLEPRAVDAESLATAWVPAAEVDAGTRELLPAFGAAWPTLRGMLRRLVLVVDGANVVGSRPDGWWRDRAGAARRLAGRLAALGSVPAGLVGLPGDEWVPSIELVTEGAARSATGSDGLGGAGGPGGAVGVRVVPAPGHGDDEIVARARLAAADPRTHAVVVTADRELRARCADVGAGHLGPGTLWELLDAAGA